MENEDLTELLNADMVYNTVKYSFDVDDWEKGKGTVSVELKVRLYDGDGATSNRRVLDAIGKVYAEAKKKFAE